jgi:hypothetical protein
MEVQPTTKHNVNKYTWDCGQSPALHLHSESQKFFSWIHSPFWASDSSFSRPHDHTQTHHTRYGSPGRVISPTQRPLPDNTKHSQETDRHPAVFEPAIPASERPQTHALDSADTGIGESQIFGV